MSLIAALGAESKSSLNPRRGALGCDGARSGCRRLRSSSGASGVTLGGIDDRGGTGRLHALYRLRLRARSAIDGACSEAECLPRDAGCWRRARLCGGWFGRRAEGGHDDGSRGILTLQGQRLCTGTGASGRV